MCCYIDVIYISDVQQATNLPILIGSGVTNDNLEQYQSANGLIVGSYFKQGGHWNNALDEKRLKKFMGAVKSLQEKIKNG